MVKNTRSIRILEYLELGVCLELSDIRPFFVFEKYHGRKTKILLSMWEAIALSKSRYACKATFRYFKLSILFGKIEICFLKCTLKNRVDFKVLGVDDLSYRRYTHATLEIKINMMAYGKEEAMKRNMFMCLFGKLKGDTMNGSRNHAFDDRPSVIREGSYISGRERII